METNRVRICVPVCERDLKEFERASKQAAEVGDILELRLDCLDERAESAFAEVFALARRLERPLIFTFRPSEQGGHRVVDVPSRRQFWDGHGKYLSEGLLDIELDLAQVAGEAIPWLDWQRTICSYHDFTGVPADLDEIYERMAKTLARYLKIAVAASDAVDCLPLFRLMDRASQDGREIIAIAMGPAGVATRILGPARGNYLTYGAIDGERGTAPGQVTAQELRELYRIDLINRDTQIMGVVGSPVGHSISPQIHNAAFAASGIDAVYLPFEVRDLPAFMTRMVHPRTRELKWNLRGLSVTAPHKTAVMDLLDWIEPAANEIGAVNTIVVKADGLHGYNTDVIALLIPIRDRLGSLREARCAVIGAGGAAKAVLWCLRNEGAAVTVFARDQQKGGVVAEKFGARCESLADARFNEFDVVINATPLGTDGPYAGDTPASADQLRGARLVYDLVYNPTETLFMRQARVAGCDAVGGLPMLVLQGLEQFKLWTGIDARAEVMFAAADEALAKESKK
jgi:3-dehydroquinate dehydratase / shikimate dehydrogenase